MREVIFDLETTGFRFDEGHRIVEIGAVEMIGGALTGENFHAYVNPERDMPEGAFKVHGLSEKFLRDKPVFTDPSVAEAFIAFVGDAELVAHNGLSFDVPFLNDELKAAGFEPLKNKVTDTLHIARRKFPGSPASLDALCSRYKIDLNEREKEGHGALLDSELLAAVYIELNGGAQAGLDFSDEKAKAVKAGGARIAVRKRPSPLKSLVTDEEANAHANFIAELGDDSVWAKSQS